MKKIVQILFIVSLSFSSKLVAQAYFTVSSSGFSIAKDTLTGADSLKFSYQAVYHGPSKGADSSFSGTITTNIITGKNTTPLAGNVTTITKPVGTGQSISLTGSFKLNSHYFDNGNGPDNIIVIWPTGGRAGGGTVASVDSIHATKSIVISGLVGIDPYNNDFDLVRIFPNPATSFLNLELNDPTIKIKSIRILDITGKEILRQASDVKRIDVTYLKTGLYLLEIECADNQKAIYSFMVGQ